MARIYIGVKWELESTFQEQCRAYRGAKRLHGPGAHVSRRLDTQYKATKHRWVRILDFRSVRSLKLYRTLASDD